MSQKCALIVDDSRSARVVLQRMLETHELDVDMAESAEEALTYLADHRPDVIFMDHMMPGMDGFEAVQAIKQNPNTATIPIMMYTSQEGELYVGQARALGAVGVLPKQVEPVEVSRMLKSLRLIPGVASADGDELRDALADVESSGITRIDEIDHNLRDLIQGLFEQQRAILRRDMLDSYETIAARVAEEISPAADDDGVEEGPAAPARLSGAATAALLLLGAVAGLFAFLYWQAESRWLNERDARAALADSLRSEQAFSADGTVELQRSLTESQLRLEAVYGDAIAAIEWAFNLDARYPWDSVPLDDALAGRVSQLVTRLESIDFAGLVMIETHVGDYCYQRSAGGDLVPAPGPVALSDCDQIGLALAEAQRRGTQQSVAFANLLGTVSSRTDGRITMAVSTEGNTAPLQSYPVDVVDVTAGEWNAVASANQRVVVSLIAAQE